MTVFTPSPELVAVAWLRSLKLPLVSDVSTTLPAGNRWTQPCYVQATTAGGASNVYDLGRNPLIMVNIWGGPKKYGECNSVAEIIRDAAKLGTNQHRDFIVKAGAQPTYPVHLAEVSVWQDPKTLRDPAESVPSPTASPRLARTTMMLAFVYQVNRSF